ncbi:hypothetical protein QTO34_012528 [Cnephaeus nilssonii]|uniref:Uncharacterized protein n=1 Tax=Cnephaeus nilssonii TaxID=3371016 RepID=A0AA40HBC0_CNENI|nr:hypothetical protein QTO34_012528 [Eptesicus nilssonii]
MQIKINELWKNFGFKKDSEKLPSCKKPEPLSPVKDNIQLTPETERRTSFTSRNVRVRRERYSTERQRGPPGAFVREALSAGGGYRSEICP